MLFTPKRIDIRDGKNFRGFCFLHWNEQSKRALIDVQCSIPLPSNLKLTHDSIEAAESYFTGLYHKNSGWSCHPENTK
jgi:hypothetical protein